MRLKLLQKPIGRGRGSGADASAETVAWVLLAVLVADNLSDIGGRLKIFANGKIGAARGPFKKGCTLIDALRAILDRPEIASKISVFIVNRQINTALIGWMVGETPNIENEYVSFGESNEPKQFPDVLVRASITSDLLREIANKLHDGE
ncbi:hypothetical protein [Bradyrhizobium sp. AZCC 1578]|uniref:hypothetical protein n=1 Tax=Bradyrhizobium sp. AZCC 1578 TaxID=3117027 RepID=UPI002FEF84F0